MGIMTTFEGMIERHEFEQAAIFLEDNRASFTPELFDIISKRAGEQKVLYQWSSAKSFKPTVSDKARTLFEKLFKKKED